MDQTIWIFGNGDERPGHGFTTPGELQQYIREDIFQGCGGRYRYTLTRNATVIVLSRQGLAYGHFDIESREPPTEQDRVKYDRTKQVYLVTRVTLYENPVQLRDLGIAVGQYGVKLTEQQLALIESNAGELQRFP